MSNYSDKPLVVNLFAGPGAGKTVMAMSVVVELKKRGIHAEYVSEVAKDCVYHIDNFRLSKTQIRAALEKISGSYVTQCQLFNEQRNRLDVFAGSNQVDVVITDSPLVLSAAYLQGDHFRSDFEDMCKTAAEDYHNLNYFLNRVVTEFETEGRIHDLSESLDKDVEIEELLNRLEQPFEKIDREQVSLVADEIETEISKRKEL